MASIPIIAPSPSSRILYRENQLRVTPTSLLALTPDPPAGGRHSNSRDRPPGPASFPANHGVVRRATQCLSPPMLEEEHMYGLFGASPTVAARIWLIAKVGEHRWANEEVTRSWPKLSQAWLRGEARILHFQLARLRGPSCISWAWLRGLYSQPNKH